MKAVSKVKVAFIFFVISFNFSNLVAKQKGCGETGFQKLYAGTVGPFSCKPGWKVVPDSPTRLINHIVDNLDISRVIDTYKFGGRSPYHLCMMLKVFIYGYLNNIYSCRKIENALNDRVSFMWLSGNQPPDHNTINRFRSSHLKDTIHEIFTRVVVMLVGWVI